MKYLVSYQHPHSQFVEIDYIIEKNITPELFVQLPAWRPGRYELGNFAKNIQKWTAMDENGNILKHQKIKKDLWKIETQGTETIHIKYNYYAAELNAGSTWLDEQQLYVNPVNCFLYVPERINEECFVELNIPGEHKVATGMKILPSGELYAKNYHELVDAPFIASSLLQNTMFVYEGKEFHIWMLGLDNPDWSKLLNDFFVFVNEQYVLFGEFPFNEYHFLFQILPFKAYHGVEHHNSTVITLGPSYAVMNTELYNELLGVSSHELFHAWNIKQIRPLEMMPYDYTAENYSRLGYVAEGVTTYYGDLLLFRSGIFSEEEYFKIFNSQLQKHFDNFGRLNLSVAESSFDTWLDGYSAGIPNRKTSIYTEGCLVAFMTDILIRRGTNNQKSLDDVMRVLYQEFGKKQKGYSESDYQKIIENISGRSFEDFFRLYIYGTQNFEFMLEECLDYIGCSLKKMPSEKHNEARLGFKTSEENNKTIVKSIFPGSFSDKAGLKINDEIIAVNGVKINADLNQWCNYFAQDKKAKIVLSLFSSGILKNISLEPNDKETFYQCYFITKKNNSVQEKINAFNDWSKKRFIKNIGKS